jgi:hypothetical protein
LQSQVFYKQSTYFESGKFNGPAKKLRPKKRCR